MYGSSSSTSSKRGLILDFEGTLVDFQWNLEKGEEEAREVLKTLAGEELEGKSYADIYNLASSLGVSHIIDPIYDKWDLDALSRWSLRSGAVKTIKSLKNKGIKIGILSNVGMKALYKALVRFDLFYYIDVIVSRDHIDFLKPHPSSIDKMLSLLSLNPSQVLYVGDSLSDLFTANSKNVDIAFFVDGETPRETLEAHGACLFLNSFDDILNLLN